MALVSFSPRSPKFSGPNDPRLLMYRLSKNRSRSCGATLKRNRQTGETALYESSVGARNRCVTPRRAEFCDSAIIVVDTGPNNERSVRDINGVKSQITEKLIEMEEDGKLQKDFSKKTDSFARLDMTTLKNLGWVANRKQEVVTEDDDICRFSKVEFRRLQEQVKDVSMNLKNKFRTSAYQTAHQDGFYPSGEKLYQRPNGENPSQVYRSQLAASLRAFQQKQWPPLTPQEVETSYIRCKPVQAANERPSTSCSMRAGSPTRLQRPKSVPPPSLRPKSARSSRADTPSDVRPGKFDTLSPSIISDLMGPTERPNSAYEETVDEKSPFVEELVAETKKLLETDDTSTTSGIDSGASENESPSSDEDSDFEPEIDESISIPQLNLRPEKLDSIYIPEPKRGWRQFDFDMSNIDLPPYEFASPIPEDLEDLDLKQMAKLKWNWRNHVKTKGSRDSDMEGILDRLVEFERLQMDTIDWENKRAAQIRKALPRRNNSAKSLQSLIKDKRCDPNCLQATCFGDCPEKLAQSQACEFCRQTFCTGTCRDVKYEQRMRQPRVEEERPVTPKPPFPRACSSCQKRHNAKFINANNLVLGAQRYTNATFVRGQSSLKTKDLRPKTPSNLPKDVLKEFEKLNIEPSPPPRPNTSASMYRPRSRNAIFPGKSFSSQRKNSLTDIDKVGSGKSKKRSKSTSKPKRPKTAG